MYLNLEIIWCFISMQTAMHQKLTQTKQFLDTVIIEHDSLNSWEYNAIL